MLTNKRHERKQRKETSSIFDINMWQLKDRIKVKHIKLKRIKVQT